MSRQEQLEEVLKSYIQCQLEDNKSSHFKHYKQKDIQSHAPNFREVGAIRICTIIDK